MSKVYILHALFFLLHIVSGVKQKYRLLQIVNIHEEELQ